MNLFTKSCLTNNYLSCDPHFVILACAQSWNIFDKLMKLWSPPDFFHKNMSQEQLVFTWSTFRDSSMGTKLKYFQKPHTLLWVCQNLYKIAKIAPWFEGKLDNFPAIVQQKFLYLCIRRLYLCRIKLQKNWRLHSSQFYTRHRNVDLAYHQTTDMRKLVLNLKNSALIQTNIRQLSGHSSAKIFIRVCSCIYAD